MTFKRIISIVFSVLFFNALCSADHLGGAECQDVPYPAKISLKVLYDVASSDIDLQFGNNGQNISQFFAALDSLQNSPFVIIDSLVCIRSSSSPEGKIHQNSTLSRRRATALESLFRRRYHEGYTIDIQSVGEDWSKLSELLKQSDLHGREEAARIIDNMPTYIIMEDRIVGGRKKAAMDMWRGRFWWIIHKQLFPDLRQATLTVNYAVDMQMAEVTETAAAPAVVVSLADALARKIPENLPITSEKSSVKPVFAFKTNLLYDAASLINLGFEIPLGRSFSLAADAVFPWWQNRKNDITIQMLGATLEGRYWFGDRSVRAPMTGFFCGVYAGGGIFDFQLGKLTSGNGVQGDFYILGGVSAGYAHEICRNLRLEYSLGVGYLRTDFQDYISVKDTKFGNIKAIPYPWNMKRTSGVLPTKACISLVWMLNSRKGGAR